MPHALHDEIGPVGDHVPPIAGELYRAIDYSSAG
jgi:hypothetical protein